MPGVALGPLGLAAAWAQGEPGVKTMLATGVVVRLALGEPVTPGPVLVVGALCVRIRPAASPAPPRMTTSRTSSPAISALFLGLGVVGGGANGTADGAPTGGGPIGCTAGIRGRLTAGTGPL